ncbi:aliphatic sulfonate ABC transporter substrate-binding protein [Nesterenkonia sp. E16_7]|uniref:aliphatic sulfonate ABC transporter substrate-binding protein n=1 Tax=unclassified Nesterenkonia TaxID=2629769 RepID=UPI001A917BE3|nr:MULTISPECIES: aliphatic sulfonate ABC transporter substrate-binding protein [unclassified Nesterenkonia]MBO0595310.1 aliphatic sulfonate ABC transporter substrate-binding protein [Nesterenkonia sp. E16_10]MBO0598037.1 aliphatic sulfonate ABC transporter substrate-binding protein [Nesterenkonia sp. E16_7]
MPSTSASRSARTPRSAVKAVSAAAALALLATGCGQGGEDEQLETLNIDFATYNPLSLIILENGWLEEELEELDVDVQWVQSQGSNRANENLRAGNIHVGSTAGSAALLNRAVGADTHTILIENQPEWSALVTQEGSDIESVEDLEGASIAATLATDPYFFMARALQEAGLSVDDVEVQALQHADGRQALENGDVDAWAGLDPIMAGAEAEGAELLYRNVDFNTYSVINATGDFVENHPDVAQIVVNVYEQAREWAKENPEGTAEILSEYAGIELEIAEAVITERTNFEVDPVPGDDVYTAMEAAGPFFVENGDVDSQEAVDEALDSLFYTEFAENIEATEAEGTENAAEEADIEEEDE